MKILTFDIEEWFHILDHEKTKNEKNWLSFDSRIHKNTDRVLSILNNSGVKASFFILGWIAEKYPEIVKQISDRGYEIGSHTSMHQLVYEQDKVTFKNDVDRSIKSLEDITGKKVKIFRAPGFSITEKNKWAFEVLYELGIESDSSVFPAKRSHGGLPSYSTSKPSIIKYNGVELKEYPINTKSLLNQSFIYSGGGYFRVIPYFLIKKWTKEDNYIMTYFHPRDFDYNQPIIKSLSVARKFKSYAGLKKCKSKLEKWLRDFEFIDLHTADEKIDWTSVERINI
tara:strand:- start:2510 stop:3358 length:849 start_codon:yes stop_codon:yes gene_type:complete